MKKDSVYGALYGVAIDDALGVPVEFNSRARLQQNPVTDFEGYGTHEQLPGTFSDDASLTFCTAESLCKGYSLDDMAMKFVKWHIADYWTARGNVFDIGNTTAAALYWLERGTKPGLSGEPDEQSNGNGSLMRILPLVFYVKNFEIDKRDEIVSEVSAITHAHDRSTMACFYYIEFALQLLNGNDKLKAYDEAAAVVKEYFRQPQFNPKEVKLFAQVLEENIAEKKLDDVRSSGYVMDCLLAAIWCFMTTDNYKDCVLKAVNLGDDTDTTAAVAGGLAGLYYGVENIPEEWRMKIARTADIADLCERFYNAMIKE